MHGGQPLHIVCSLMSHPKIFSPTAHLYGAACAPRDSQTVVCAPVIAGDSPWSVLLMPCRRGALLPPSRPKTTPVASPASPAAGLSAPPLAAECIRRFLTVRLLAFEVFHQRGFSAYSAATEGFNAVVHDGQVGAQNIGKCAPVKDTQGGDPAHAGPPFGLQAPNAAAA